MTLINFSDMPDDPIGALMWLSGLDQAVRKEINAAWQEQYFKARLEGVFDTALDLHFHSPKRALAWTRHENESRGRVVTRWRDGY